MSAETIAKISGLQLSAVVDDETGRIKPLLIPLYPEVGRLLGGIGKSATYDMIRRHRVPIVKNGGRSTVALADVERIANELLAVSRPLAPEAPLPPKRRRRGDPPTEEPSEVGLP